MRAIGYVWRLYRIGRMLARHDALFPVDYLDPPKIIGILLPWLLGRPDHQLVDGLRPGERLALALEKLGPSFIKLGQALSVRADLLGEQMAVDLGRLRDRLPPFSAAEAEATIQAEFGVPVDEIFASFDPEAVAAASIAQVHQAEVLNADGERQPVAVKILRPGIESAFSRDLSMFYWLATRLEHWRPELRRLRPVEVVQTLQDSVDLEMDLRLEAAAAAEFSEDFAASEDLRIPSIDWGRTARRVMTQEWVGGLKLDDLDGLRASGVDPRDVAQVVLQSFLRQALEFGFFHADLHPGNLFVEVEAPGVDDDLPVPGSAKWCLVVVDFGIMGRLDMETRLFMAEMLHAFVTGNYHRAAQVHFDAGYVPAHKSVEAFAQACRSIGAPILGKPVTEISIGKLLAQLFQITETFEMQTQPQLLLLQKTMVTVEGVARRLDPEINFWTVSEPVVAAWMQAHMTPDAQLKRAATAAIHFGTRLPHMIDRLENWLNQPQPTPAETHKSGPWRFRPWALILAFLVALFIF